MKKLLKPFVLAVTLGLGFAMIATTGCAPRNPNRAAVGQHVCKGCGYTAPTSGKCPSCHVDMTATDQAPK